MREFFVPFRIQMTGLLMISSCALIEIYHYGVWWGLTAAVLLIASLLLHEVGHMLMALALGVKVSEFGLCLLGAYNRRARANSRRNEILICLAGPLINFALIIPCIILPRIGFELTLCNFMLGVGNLLPIPSSDGLRILQTIWRPFPAPYPMVRPIPVNARSEQSFPEAA